MRVKLTMTAITGFGLLLSLCTQLVAAYLFGASGAMDAYFAGVALPVALVLLANEVAALHVVPALHRVLAQEGEGALADFQARLLVSNLLVWSVLAAGAMAGRELVIAALFPGFGAAAADAAARVLALQLVIVPFGTTAALLLHFRFVSGSYARPYLVFLLTPLFVIGAGLGWHDEAGAASLAIGSAAGALVQFAALFALQRGWRLPLARALRRLAWPSWRTLALLAAAVAPVQAATLVDRHFAAALGEGALSAISYSWFFAAAAVALVFRGWSMPVFHAISGDAATELERFRRRMAESTRELLVVAGLLAVALQVAGPAALALLLERGAFAPEATQRVAEVFRCHALSVPGMVLYLLLVRACCATGRQKAAAALGALACVGYVAFARGLMGYGATGLAAANATTWSVVGAIALAYMQRAGWLAWRRPELPLLAGAIAARRAARAIAARCARR